MSLKPRAVVDGIVRIGWVASLVFLLMSQFADAQQVVSTSSDVMIDLGASLIAADEDVVVDNQAGIAALANLGTLPQSSDVIAFGLDINGDRFLVLDTTTLLLGGVIARRGDVVRYDGVNYSIAFDASAVGLPVAVQVDATSLSANGLLLSFDTTVDLGGGLVVADEDLVEWDGTSLSLLFDGSTAGVGDGLDIDAAQHLGGDRFFLSFDTSGQLGSVVFDDEDILRFDGSQWSLEFDASLANSAWNAADVDAVMVPEPGWPASLGAGLMLLVGLDSRKRLWRPKRVDVKRTDWRIQV